MAAIGKFMSLAGRFSDKDHDRLCVFWFRFTSVSFKAGMVKQEEKGSTLIGKHFCFRNTDI